MRSSFTVATAASILLLGNASADQEASFIDADFNSTISQTPNFVEVDQFNDHLSQNDMCYKLKTKAKYDAKIAAFNPAFLPIPDYVMNDEVRNFEPPAEAYYMKHGDGADEISWIILDDNSKWPEQVWAIRNGFKDYLRENDLNLPDSFLEDDGDDIRYYLGHNKDYGQAYEEML